MATPPPYFARVIPEVNFPLLQTKRIVVVGVGQVGSKIATELANATVGSLRFIDPQILEESNLYRHVLPRDYLGKNKADSLAVYLARRVPGLTTQGVPHAVRRGLSDELLDEWFEGADLIVATADNPEAQLQVGVTALKLEIPAIFPALYPQNNGGEIIIQFDRRLPCFGCVTGFRADIPQLEGVTGLGFFGTSVIETALQLALGLLEPGSGYARMVTPRRNEAPHQIFFLNRARELTSRPLGWSEGCPSCGGRPTVIDQVPESSIFPPRLDRSPPDISLRAFTRTPRPIATRDSPWRGIAVVGSIIAVLLILALALGGSANHSATTTATPTTASPINGTPASVGVPTTSGTGSQERAAARHRIAQLSFACIERYICHVYGVTHTLPLFINGMDVRLRQYLEAHGYSDAWTDNTGSLNGQTIGPERSSENNPSHYVSSYDINGNEIGTGLIYRDELPSNFGNGPRLAALPSSGQWEITWTLKNSAGQLVKSLTYPVQAVECTGSGAAYCGTFQSYRENAANDGSDNGHYDSTFYHPPPVFPY